MQCLDPGFPRVRQPQRWGANLLFSKILAKNYIKMRGKKLDREWEHTRP